jgi:hypothetical protein
VNKARPSAGRTARWAAIALFGLSACLVAAAIVLYVLNSAGGAATGIPPPDDLAMAGLFPLVGMLIAQAQPGNRIGWVCLLIGFSGALAVWSPEYAVYALVTNPGVLPGGALASWLQVWAWSPGWVGFVLLMLLFPTGRLLSRRWTWPAVVEIAAVATWIALLGGLTWQFRGPLMLGEGPSEEFGEIGATLEAAIPLIFLVMLLALLAAVAGAIVRFRRSVGVERQQLKWFVLAVSLTAVSAGATYISTLLLPLEGFLGGLIYAVEVAAFSSGPVAIGIAILRYRLFDIDIIVRRTLVYATLTVTLALIYLGSVVLLQRLFHWFSGQDSDLAIVASTLAIAALFNPARSRIQSAISRRFYRRRYDAVQTMAAFHTIIRDEVDLDTLSRVLLDVVGETMQPASVALWLRDAPARPGFPKL